MGEYVHIQPIIFTDSFYSNLFILNEYLLSCSMIISCLPISFYTIADNISCHVIILFSSSSLHVPPSLCLPHTISSFPPHFFLPLTLLHSPFLSLYFNFGSDTLLKIFGDLELESLFLTVASICKSVLACRASPEQKR